MTKYYCNRHLQFLLYTSISWRSNDKDDACVSLPGKESCRHLPSSHKSHFLWVQRPPGWGHPVRYSGQVVPLLNDARNRLASWQILWRSIVLGQVSHKQSWNLSCICIQYLYFRFIYCFYCIFCLYVFGPIATCIIIFFPLKKKTWVGRIVVVNSSTLIYVNKLPPPPNIILIRKVKTAATRPTQVSSIKKHHGNYHDVS